MGARFRGERFLETGSTPARYDLLEAGLPLRAARNNFGWFALAIFALAIALGGFVGVLSGRLFLGLLLSGAFGSVLLWVWLPSASERLLSSLDISTAGIQTRDASGVGHRLDWLDPKVTILLEHPLESHGFPYRSTRIAWQIRVRPPRMYGVVSEDCYERLITAARSAGATVRERTYWHRDRLGGWWVVETTVRAPRR